MTGEIGHTIIEKIGIEPLTALQCEYDGIEDIRFQPFAEHLLSDIVLITLIAVLDRCDEGGNSRICAEKRDLELNHFHNVPGKGRPPKV